MLNSLLLAVLETSNSGGSGGTSLTDLLLTTPFLIAAVTWAVGLWQQNKNLEHDRAERRKDARRESTLRLRMALREEESRRRAALEQDARLACGEIARPFVLAMECADGCLDREIAAPEVLERVSELGKQMVDLQRTINIQGPRLRTGMRAILDAAFDFLWELHDEVVVDAKAGFVNEEGCRKAYENAKSMWEQYLEHHDEFVSGGEIVLEEIDEETLKRWMEGSGVDLEEDQDSGDEDPSPE